MKYFLYYSIVMAVFLTTISGVKAQRKGQVDPVIPRAGNMVVDGILDDWNGSVLLYDFPGQDLNFELRNDNRLIYVAVQVVDQDRQLQALSQGVSFMINVGGKRREGPRVVFPIADRLAFRTIMSSDNEERPEDMRLGALQAVRGVFVNGFEEILDGMISLDNQYGIEAFATIDSLDVLNIEMAFPISYLKLSEADKKTEMAFNIKINGLIMPSSMPSPMPRSNQGAYGYPGRSMQRGTPQAPREERGYWGKFKLSLPVL